MSDHRPYRTLTKVLFAAQAPRAVILRRGPRNRYCLIAWNTDTDTFSPGQWMKGNVRLTDLSPRGDKLLYFAEQFTVRPRPHPVPGPYDPLRARAARPRSRALVRPGRKVPRYLRASLPDRAGIASPRPIMGSWTAVSTPPYFSALAIWPSIGRWTGGGTFRHELDILLREHSCGLVPIRNVPMPATVKVRRWLSAADARHSAYAPSVTETEQHARVAAVLLDAGLKWVDWIDLRHRDMLFAGDGRIFRLRNWQAVAEASYLAAAQPLADLRDMAFNLLPAPASAMRW